MEEASSIVPSGTKSCKKAKWDKTFPQGGTTHFWSSKLVDFELEMLLITTDANVLGETLFQWRRAEEFTFWNGKLF